MSDPVKIIHFEYEFHAVGQGMFASGRVGTHPFLSPHQREFVWIYDCGTSSDLAFLHREIDEVRNRLLRGKVDALILSHFDKDHVIGVQRLVQGTRVDRLFLPYVPLVQRMLLAVTEAVADPDLVQFLVNPVGFLERIGGENIGEIILIMPGSGQAGGPLGENRGDFPSAPPDSPDFVVDDRKDSRVEPPTGDNPLIVNPAAAHKFSFRRDGTSITVGGFWEFVFYNRPVQRDLDHFTHDVSRIVTNFTQPDGTIRDPAEMIRQLKQVYGVQFGTSAIARNKISLVTYSGPIYAPGRHLGCAFIGAYPATQRPRHPAFRWRHPRSDKCSLLYTGDFPIKRDSLDDVKAFFGPQRMERVEILQVPHHGSRHSWFPSAANAMAHNYSLFSSRRHCTNHPHQTVINDLQHHRPVFVNEYQGALWGGWITV